jgi:hypothetical protein
VLFGLWFLYRAEHLDNQHYSHLLCLAPAHPWRPWVLLTGLCSGPRIRSGSCGNDLFVPDRTIGRTTRFRGRRRVKLTVSLENAYLEGFEVIRYTLNSLRRNLP